MVSVPLRVALILSGLALSAVACGSDTGSLVPDSGLGIEPDLARAPDVRRTPEVGSASPNDGAGASPDAGQGPNPSADATADKGGDGPLLPSPDGASASDTEAAADGPAASQGVPASRCPSGGSAPTGALSVLERGAMGNGTADDTAAITAALAAGTLIHFPKGHTFVVKGLLVPSGRALCGYGATIRLANGRPALTPVIDLANHENIEIAGLTINGNGVNQNPEATREDRGMHGIRSYGARGVRLQDLLVTSAYTDGLYLRDASYIGGKEVSSDFGVFNVRFDANGRQGTSIIKSNRLLFHKCVFTRTKGRLPEAGVDIEPNQNTDHNIDVRFVECEFSNNTGAGLMTHLNGSRLEGLQIVRSKIFGNSDNVALKVAGGEKEGSDARVVNALIQDTEIRGPVIVGSLGTDERGAHCVHENTTFDGARIYGTVNLRRPSSGSVIKFINQTCAQQILDNFTGDVKVVRDGVKACP